MSVPSLKHVFKGNVKILVPTKHVAPRHFAQLAAIVLGVNVHQAIRAVLMLSANLMSVSEIQIASPPLHAETRSVLTLVIVQLMLIARLETTEESVLAGQVIQEIHTLKDVDQV